MNLKLLFFGLFLSTTFTFAQGIAVQGIARDNADAAITDQVMNFTVTIADATNNQVYQETQSIRTDNFGVYSHVVGTGTRTNGIGTSFDAIAFGSSDMKIIITVNYNGTDIEVYNKPFYYTPYAHHAKNGAPTGAIMPFVGTTAPAGWALCDGSALPSTATSLIAMIGNNTPDLQGMFLRGTGDNPVNGQPGPALKATQNDAYGNHAHVQQGTHNSNTAGNHGHTYKDVYYMNALGHFGPDVSPIPAEGTINGIPYLGPSEFPTGNNSFLQGKNGIGANSASDDGNVGLFRNTATDNTGNHFHQTVLSGDTGVNGGNETRPVNYGVNYIIKL